MTLQINKGIIDENSQTFNIITIQKVIKIETALSEYKKILLLITLENDKKEHIQINPYKDTVLIY